MPPPPSPCWRSFPKSTRSGGLTILLVTHDLPLVRQHAQQVIWLHQGKVLNGTVAELLTPQRMAEIFEMEIS